MKHHLGNPLKLLLLAVVLAYAACNRPVREEDSVSGQPLDEERIREIVREEVAAALKPLGAGEMTSPKLREEIDKLVLERVAEELEKTDWEKRLGSEALAQSLRNMQKRVDAGGKSRWEEVDVSGIQGVENQIDYILAQYEHMDSYSHNNAVVKQLVKYGPQARDLLYQKFKDLNQGGHGPNIWITRHLLRDTLNQIVTEEDKEFLLEDYRSEHPLLDETVRRFRFAEAGDIALERLRKQDEDGRDYVRLSDMRNVLDYRPEEGVPVLLEKLENGASNSSWVARELDKMGIEIEPQLRAAAHKTNSDYEKITFTELMLKRGMPEGLALAADVLLNNSEKNAYHNSHYIDQVRNSLRRYANIVGDDEEVGKWLAENRDKLVWNEQLQMFEER